MKRKAFVFFSILLCAIIMISCSKSKTDNQENEEAVNNEPEEKEEVDEPDSEPDKELEAEPEEEGVENESNEMELGDYEIYIGGEMIETEDKIIINGVSNLIPEARVIGEVSVGEEEEEEYFADTTELVEEDGSFHIEIAHHNLDKETEVAVKFDFDGQQDDAVFRHYGERGQKVTGPYIYKVQGEVGGGGPQNIYQQAKVIVTFDPSEEEAVRQFKKPDWYPIPDDTGDPRVWMEVEEVNNEEEYYYVHGRSNLIEGSMVHLTFGSSVYKTRILPDGSFDFKFPYEYKENTPFVINFRPGHWNQWNEVKEAYGEIGQKFVGSLVVANKYDDSQYLKLEVDQESREISVPDNVELTIEGTEVTMLVPDNLLFDFDQFDLKDASKEILGEIGETLDELEQKDMNVKINGYTDNVGNKEYNLKLSENRAEEVKAFLSDKIKGKNTTFTTKGFGDANPIASNDSEKGQAKNRRVEIVINLR